MEVWHICYMIMVILRIRHVKAVVSGSNRFFVLRAIRVVITPFTKEEEMCRKKGRKYV